MNCVLMQQFRSNKLFYCIINYFEIFGIKESVREGKQEDSSAGQNITFIILADWAIKKPPHRMCKNPVKK